ncbi:MAG: hypothetical protein KBT36_14345 [Kurthia sp.]|nr:hypothetical protein [Candidatus Kurthia equi]
MSINTRWNTTATELFEEFEIASRLGTMSLLKKLLSCQLLILDDFGLSKVRVD